MSSPSPQGASRKEGGRLVVISGPSGAGKTTVAHRLLQDPRFERAITATTRAPRAGEKPDVDYHFLTDEEFRTRLERGGFLEHAMVHGNRYGTPREAPERVIGRGRHCLLVVDVQGAAALRQQKVAAIYVFLHAPDESELRRRLQDRGLDHPTDIERRLAAAPREIAESGLFDLSLVNAEVEATARRIAAEVGVDLKSPQNAPPGRPPR